MEWLFLILGAVLGVAGNFAYEAIRGAMERRAGGKLDIEGKWGEWTPDGYGRQFSAGEIKYRFWKRRYDFDGTNYFNDGQPYCHWVTTASYIDKDRKEFHYIFANHDLTSPQVRSYGYGVISLVRTAESLTPVSGFYLYSGPTGARQMSHTMHRISDPALFSDRSENVSEDLKRVFPDEWNRRSDRAPVVPSD